MAVRRSLDEDIANTLNGGYDNTPDQRSGNVYADPPAPTFGPPDDTRNPGTVTVLSGGGRRDDGGGTGGGGVVPPTTPTPPTTTPPTTTPPTTPTAPRKVGPYTAPNGFDGSPEDWIKASLNSGITPAEVAATFNKVWGASTGNEAVVYPSDATHKFTTIGIPSGYFTSEGGKTLGPNLTEWGFVQRGPEGPGGGGPNTSFSQFKDPAAQLLEQLALDRVNKLSQTPNRPLLDQYVQSLLADQATQKSRAADFASTVRTRADQLRQTPYTQGDEAVMRAKAFDALERRRQQTLKNRREEVFARGFAPTSGLVADAENQVNTQFENQRTGVESDLLNNAIDEAQRRKDKAVALESLATEALNGGDLGSLQMQAQAADTEDSRIQEADQRDRERLVAAGIPVDLANNRALLALQILGGGGSGPSSVINSLLGLADVGTRNRAINVAGSNNNLAGIGALLSLLLPRK